MGKKKPDTLLLENRRARHLYFLSDFMVAGLVLTGTEIKSLRKRDASLSDSYIVIVNGEAYIRNMHIANYKDGTIYNVDHLRDRKLLLHKREIAKIYRELQGTSVTCVPVKCFLSNGYAKLEIAIGKGKKLHDKRETIKERDQKRMIDRAKKAGRNAEE